MARLAIALMIVGLCACVVWAIASALRPVETAMRHGASNARKGAQMPDGFRNVAFVILLVLMIGVTSGVVGAL